MILLTAMFIGHSANACGKKITRVKMERTPCFGACPWFFITIMDDGTLFLEGKKDIKQIGRYQAKISTDHAKTLLKKCKILENAEKDYTKKNVADIPMINYEYEIKGETKSVRSANFGPEELTKLAEEIDQLLETATWIKIENEDE